jgi:hypothetical protein
MSNKETFTKQQFLESNQYTPIQKDVLQGLLQEQVSYTHDQVKKIIENFAKRTVQ